MNIEERYPLLIGHSSQGNHELHSIQEVADFICTQGLESDLLITQEDGSYFLNTFGIYIDRIADMEYREALLKVLIPMQMELEGTAEIDEEPSPEDERLEEFNKRLEPFELYQCGNGKYGLSLPFSFLQEPYENYGQAAFNRFAEEHGEEAKNSFGLYTHGSGYEWEKVFRPPFRMMRACEGFRLTVRPEDFTATARMPNCWNAWGLRSRLSAMIRSGFRKW